MSMLDIKAGDLVRHLPSDEKWVVCGVDYSAGELIPCGYPFPSIAKLNDCELIASCKGLQTEEMKKALLSRGLNSFIQSPGNTPPSKSAKN